ncbi:hypothetical protein [Pseudomonas sp. P1.31]|uniref:hypothetical protein n=1 Tax=Pseudomonas sp. P1.31 TaxID=1699311 RepID=UPI00069DC5A1|nr:hypothetical protein [Pseudomonas sp. P1.31]
MRDLGTAGEKYFGVLCAAAGMAANKSETDVNGWDLFVEIDDSTNGFDRASMHEGVIETKIQVKSTDGDRKSVDVELSNLKKMATSALPCFYVLLEFDGGDIPVRAYLRHFDNQLIQKTLRRVSDEHAKDPNVKLNKKKMRINFPDPVSPLSASIIKKMIMSHIGSSHFDYLQQKREYLKSVGFEEGSHRIKFSIIGDEKLQQLIDISLGKKQAIEIGEVHGSSLRFGVSSKRSELTSDTAVLTMPDVAPTEKGFLSFRDKSNGRNLKFPVDLYSSAFDSWIPDHFRKIRMDGRLFELYILNYGKSFNISINVHLLEHFEVEEALKMFKLTHMLSKPKNIELTFNFQNTSSTAHLNAGDGFRDQSSTIDAFEKIIKIKNYFDIDAPLHFSASDIETIHPKLNKLICVAEGAPKIFIVNFSSTDEIDAETELECFHIISFPLGRYVFLELVLFAGKAEKDLDCQYNIKPTEKTSFYKTMLNSSSIDRTIPEKEITEIIDSYESSRLVINFVPAFFEKESN